MFFLIIILTADKLTIDLFRSVTYSRSLGVLYVDWSARDWAESEANWQDVPAATFNLTSLAPYEQVYNRFSKGKQLFTSRLITLSRSSDYHPASDVFHASGSGSLLAHMR